jgi:pimeloyl-ACP methyl ester carboxylesterase
MADDVAALIKYLKVDKADVMGHSLGGGVALRTAVQHPGVVKKLVLVSIAFKRDGWYHEIREGMSQVGAAAAEPNEADADVSALFQRRAEGGRLADAAVQDRRAPQEGL